MAKPKQIEGSSIFRAPNHHKYYVTNISGGLTDQDFRFELLNEKIRETSKRDNQWKFISDAMIILTPTGAKRLFEELKKHLEVWENENGKIETESKDKHIINVK